MKFTLSLLVVIIGFTSCRTNERESNPTLKRIQGEWIHAKDTFSKVTIKYDNWISKHEGEIVDNYTISILDYLPRYASETIATEFIELVDRTDTMHFELLSATDTVLSLMHFLTGRIHVYHKIDRTIK